MFPPADRCVRAPLGGWYPVAADQQQAAVGEVHIGTTEIIRRRRYCPIRSERRTTTIGTYRSPWL